MQKTTTFISIIISLCLVPYLLPAQQSDRNVIIHLRGVYDAGIEVMNVQKNKYSLRPFLLKDSVKGGATATLTIPAAQLPGQFTVQFNYRLKVSDHPYPATKTVFVGAQDVEMWISPVYGNNPDSTWFAQSERENNTHQRFIIENAQRRDKVNLLQLFLMKYDSVDSPMYRMAESEYNKRRDEYNQWVSGYSKKYSDLFVSRLFQFQHIPGFSFAGTEMQRQQSMIDHYFEGVNLNDELLAGVLDFNDWITKYVNLNNAMYTTREEADTMLVKAARRLIEHAKKNGHPKVYGFLVDYFYNGFESYDMPAGIKMLEEYAGDHNCLTTKRLEINRRLAGLASLVVNSVAPEISMKDSTGGNFSLYKYSGTAPRRLLLFWSADCSHCAELVKQLKAWYDDGHKTDVDIIALSLDETDTEVAKWKQAVKDLPGWMHLRAESGLNSKVAYDYAVLATPYMYLISSSKNTIIGIPDNVKQLNALMKDPY